MPYFANFRRFMTSVSSNQSFWSVHLREVVEVEGDTILESAVNADVNVETAMEVKLIEPAVSVETG
ncbi:hypothetical protein EGR_11223 [Echinococcus granulosus]|uniref:Uncharacterized protein n=1 Tax=Echinococcus granulosus TaxID=6210 RepID=W6TYQ9_ECHGR|nr:hypothetical protein EGR_11223 [Echinococcus granulosus]EUB53920.1 hypothetical protein EGR_11223 [Echinococcus granulosus]